MMLIFPHSTCCCLLRPVAAGQKYLSNRSVRTGQGNPNKFSPKTINNTHLHFEVSGENVSVAEKKQKKQGASSSPMQEKSFNWEEEQKADVHLSARERSEVTE